MSLCWFGSPGAAGLCYRPRRGAPDGLLGGLGELHSLGECANDRNTRRCQVLPGSGGQQSLGHEVL